MTSKSKIMMCLACETEYEDQDLVVCPSDRTMLVTPDQDECLVGQVLNDRYELVELIHSGHGSAVYKAEHTFVDRAVAIKVLKPRLVSDQISIKRLQQNAQAQAIIDHKNIVSVLDYGFVASGQPFIAMDLLEGRNLQDVIESEGALSTEQFAQVFSPLSDALEYCHTRGIIHRDVKPGNVFISSNGRAMLIDFFLCRLLPSTDNTFQGLTQDGEIMGTPLYMSPEQCRGEKADEYSDIYSLGCSMFHALTGNPPFHGGSKLETMQMHLSQEPPKGVLPDELEGIVLKAMQKKKEDRYQSAKEICDALQPMVKAVLSVSSGTAIDTKKKGWWPF